MKIKLWHVISGLTIFFIFLLYQDSLKGFELELQDRWMQEEGPVDYRVAILAIDDESLQTIGQWPWKRDVHAKLVRTLTQGNPAVIGFDITFPLASEAAEDDAEFISAVHDAGNVVLARYGLFDRFSQNGMIESTELSEPFPELKEAASALGHLNTFPDEDSVVRKSLLEFTHNGERIKSFSSVIVQQYMEQTGDTIPVTTPSLNAFQQFHISYAGGPGSFEIIPYSMVLEGEVPADYFENRIVLIGPYTVGIKDDFLTPLDRKQSMYGVEIHANIIQNLLEGNFKQELDWKWNALFLILASILAYFICRLKSPIFMLASFIVLLVVVLYAGKFLYGQGIIISLVYLITFFITAYICSVGFNYFTELSERKRVTAVFGRYVAPQVVKQILENGEEGLKLGGSRKDLTVLFVDIRGFTTLSESVEPEEIVEILNEYLNLTANCIFEFGGTLDKFIGDATMAIFNAPLPLEDHAMQAVRTAWAMKEGAVELEKKLQAKFGKSVHFGIGIHTGPAVVGNIGSKTRMDYTVIGDTVNTAARLESNAKPGQIIISETIYEQVKDRVLTQSLGEIKVKGKLQGILIYELEGMN
ncbi:adenylate/guanylate cyclase domain-containing protein [Psychrobacillus sp.]|uniref:CHASE2 domain-containing protein n=1 Tax=Psychrobacillus sp. TaxID=1871623 RepID=UPI0028BE3ED7|nr:adenylate/guanylate cyclase domain-containing protein [Psychrobacillus sp.]